MAKFIVPMIATKRLSYNHRMLRPGDGFTATPKMAQVFELLGKAKPGRVPGSLPPPPPSLKAKPDPFDHDNDGSPGGSTKQSEPGIAAVREEYTNKIGKRPFPGWDIAELRKRMAAAGA